MKLSLAIARVDYGETLFRRQLARNIGLRAFFSFFFGGGMRCHLDPHSNDDAFEHSCQVEQLLTISITFSNSRYSDFEWTSSPLRNLSLLRAFLHHLSTNSLRTPELINPFLLLDIVPSTATAHKVEIMTIAERLER